LAKKRPAGPELPFGESPVDKDHLVKRGSDPAELSQGESPMVGDEVASPPNIEVRVAEEVDRRVEIRLQKFEARLSIHAGPLPSPVTLKAYEEALEGAAERIISRAEKQSDHRMGLERTKLAGDLKAESRGQWQAFGLALAIIVASAVLSWKGRELAGLGGIVTAIVGLAAVFIAGRRAQAKERATRLAEILGRREKSEPE